MSQRKLTAFDLVDEILTEMDDLPFGSYSKDRITFRNYLIFEIKNKLENEEIEIIEWTGE
jgi:hypothetical protein